ncbi:beta-N-acetylhexosaminidase [Malonomonas rubra DSM 5091]|uniref:beta-N-acetylhexosaminidase n=1 Tax=Malonomonas rubra DSM 5091 TaxID=1122189 RepID=A0A1M6EY23_MALRU|nr:glycoside hydrolase family 3 protein [Malonomonas rubra]SHI90348.1 beta-N-acetylhexosaminidase [Malonomonas rubra DSM 5091]
MPILLRFIILLLFVLPLSAVADTQPEDVPLQTKISQMLMVGFRGLSLNENPQFAADLRDGKIGGVILFDYDVARQSQRRNIESKSQLKALIAELQQASPRPLLIAIDQEGGQIARLKERHGFPPTRSAKALGKKDDPDFTRRETEKLAATLAEVGINLNLAPVVDLCSNPDNPVISGYQRCFSTDPQRVAKQAAAYIDAHHQKGILTSLKHFPGHGSSHQDSHNGFTDISALWNESELIPYRRLIESGHADSIMTAHVFNRYLDKEYPATLSPVVIKRLLRQKLGFEGVIISDDLQMRALADHYSFEDRIRLALQADIDILLFGNNLDYDPKLVQRAQTTINRLVAEGIISEDKIERSFQRVTRLKNKLN